MNSRAIRFDAELALPYFLILTPDEFVRNRNLGRRDLIETRQDEFPLSAKSFCLPAEFSVKGNPKHSQSRSFNHLIARWGHAFLSNDEGGVTALESSYSALFSDICRALSLPEISGKTRLASAMHLKWPQHVIMELGRIHSRQGTSLVARP